MFATAKYYKEGRLYKKMKEEFADKKLKEQFIEAVKAERQEEFLKEHGCEATKEELRAFLEEKAKENAQLSVDELENAAGGACNGETSNEVIWSVCTAGLMCAAFATMSAAIGHVGQREKYEGRLCTPGRK